MVVRNLFFAVAALIASAMPGIALAQGQEEMQFTVVRSAEPGCEPACPEWIFAQGPITSRSSGRLQALIKKLGQRRLPLVISSPGGDVEAAMKMGRAIRAAGMDVAVGTTTFMRCWPSDKKCDANKGRGAAYFGSAGSSGASCYSACPLVLAGGVHRIAEPYAIIGVHQVTTTFNKTKVTTLTRYRIVKGRKKIISTKVLRREKTGSFKTYEMNKSLEARLRSYLTGMGVDADLVDMMKATKVSDMERVTPVRAAETRLVEDNGKLNSLLGAALCRAVPAGSNCRLITAADI